MRPMLRTRRAFQTALAGGATLLLAAASALHAQTGEASGGAITGRPVPPLFFSLNGITPFHHLHSSDSGTRGRLWDEMSERLTIMREAGARGVRVDFWWGSIETERGRFEWDFPDRVIKEIVDAGLEPYPILTYNPSWSPDVSPATEEDFEAFGEFVYQAVSRNRGRVTHWEIWNEPNITPYWVPHPDPAAYGRLLRVAHERAHEADPDAVVVGMATAGPDLPFIEGAYRGGASGHLDALSFHFYDSTPDESIIEEDYRNIVRLMERHGDEGLPVHITESGLTTGPSGVVVTSTPEEQARWVVKRHLVMLAEGLEQFHYYKLKDDPPEPEPDGWWGLLEDDRSPKPAMHAYTAMVERLGGAAFLGRLRGIAVEPGQDASVEFQLYRRGGELLAVAWARGDGPRLPIRIPAEGVLTVEALDGDGSRQVQPGVDGQVVLDLTREPVWLRDLPREVEQRLAVRAEPPHQFLYPGETRELTVRLRNITEEPLAVPLAPLLDAFDGSPLSASLTAPEEPVLEAYPGGEAVAVLAVSARPEAGEFPPLLMHARLEGGLEAGAWFHYDEPYESSLRVEERMVGLDKVLTMRNRRREPVDGTVTWRMNGLTRSVANPFTGLGDSEDFVLRRSFTHLLQGETHLEAEIRDTGGITAIEEFRLLAIPTVGEAPEIDGDLSEWDDVPGVRLIPSRQQRIPDPVRFPLDNALHGAEVRLAWDTDHLYIAAAIEDPTPRVNPFREGEVWSGDSMELFLGFEGPTTATEYGPRHYQLGISPGDGGERPFVYGWRTGQGGGGRVITEARIASRETDSGYTIEAAIPLSEFGEELEPGQAIGLDVHVSFRSDPDADAREGVLIWNGTDRNFLDPSRWGLGIIIGER